MPWLALLHLGRMMHLHLVEGWRRCHKWLSMRFLALGGVVQTAVITANTTGLAQYVQPWLLTAMSDFALFCIVAAGIGRLIDQPDSNGDSSGLDKPIQP